MNRRKPKPPAKPARHRVRWDPAEDELLRELVGQGVIVREIAARLQRTWATVNTRKNMLGISAGRDECEGCGAELVRPDIGRHRLWCSSECHAAYRSRSEKVVRVAARTGRSCDECGGDIPRDRARRYCSRICSQRAWYRRQPHYAGLWTSSSNDVSDLPRGTGRGQPPASVRPSYGRQRAA